MRIGISASLEFKQGYGRFGDLFYKKSRNAVFPEHCSLGPTNETSVFMQVCGVVVRSSML